MIDLDPVECEYWNLQIGNHWLESFDFMSFQTHVNHETAVADANGRVRIVVARRDPGVPNWLDSEGRSVGQIYWRYVHPVEQPEKVETKLVKLSSLG